jgi:aminoglycoside phosphotransferase (APT) family kinase protein
MHTDQIDADVDVARRLVDAQFPEWASLPLTPVESSGTVNAIFRLGDHLSVRLPLTPNWHDADVEADILRWLAPQLPIPIHEPVAIGEPDDGYPWRWSVFRWIAGEVFSLDSVADPCRAAVELAGVVHALHALDPSQGRQLSRGGRTAMAAADEGVRRALHESRHLVDVDALTNAWDEARAAPGWPGELRWAHCDLLSGNVLMRDGALHAVIDWAAAGAGDPARDLTPTWMLFDGDSRRAFRDSFSFDDDTWMRARAYTLLGIHGVAYYEHTNPRFSADRVRTIERVLADWP